MEEIIRDRLVCGVNHDGIQQRLLSEKNLSFKNAFDLAQAIEADEKNNKILKNSSANSPELHYSSSGLPVVEGGAKRLASKKSTPKCYRCGGPHLAPVCKFKDTICRCCKKKGHLAKVCRSKSDITIAKPNPGHKKNLYMQDDQVDHDGVQECVQASVQDLYGMFPVCTTSCQPMVLDVSINRIHVDMELDTGASLSILSEKTYQDIAQQTDISPLEESQVTLKTYTGEVIKVLGITKVNARYDAQEQRLCIHVVKGEGPDLMGRDWLDHFTVTLGEVNHLAQSWESLQSMLNQHADVFNDNRGCMQGHVVKLHLKPDVKPRFLKPRTVPYILKKKVEDELDRLTNLGIISPVTSSQWAAPIVPVMKKSGVVRICGDFKTTINQAESYPLPRIEELFSNMSGGKYFSKLDLANAYLQIPVEEGSREYLTINTHKGLFQYNRLPFGVASAPVIFQRAMETLLRGLKGVSIYLDDILITGPNLTEHIENLQQVLQRLSEAGLRLNKEKCSFLLPQIEYLGHIIDAQGLHPTQEKVRAIKNSPKPKNVTELRSFFGMLTYYSKFLPTLSSNLHLYISYCVSKLDGSGVILKMKLSD